MRFLALLLSLSFLAALRAGAAESRPLNVVLIVADDLGAHDLAVTGSRFHRTPNLDRLAARGMRFDQAYAACTVCSPSRAAILTGKYPARLRLTDWIKGHARPKAKLLPPEWTQELSPREVTLAEHLKSRGYATAHVGKWHLGGDGRAPADQGFDLNLGGDHRGQPPSYFAPYGLPTLKDGPAGEYLTDREAGEASRWIEERGDEPFFLNYWPHAVHTPIQAPEDLIATHRARANQGGSQGQSHPGYAAMLERLDAAVGRILDTLERRGLADRTLVIFTSDNGGLTQGNPPPTSNAPLRAGKGSPYEGGHRVPLIVRWPGVTRPGATSSEPVMGIDLLPTILEIVASAPVDPPHALDGVSLVPLLRDPDSALKPRTLLWHYPHYHPGGATPYAALRDGDWKLIQFYESGRHELFNLRADPAEANNLAESEPERVTQLARALATAQGRVGAQWPRPNPAWTPPVLDPNPDGEIRLHARDALVLGDVLRYEPQPFKDTLGWWTRAEDSAAWRFKVSEPGAYEIVALHGCGDGSGGSRVEFAVGDQRRVLDVEATGGFQNFVLRSLGEMELAAGEHTLTVKPLSKPGLAVMDLREVILRPRSSARQSANP